MLAPTEPDARNANVLFTATAALKLFQYDAIVVILIVNTFNQAFSSCNVVLCKEGSYPPAARRSS